MNIYVREVCDFLSSVSLQQKSEATGQRYSPWTDQCYSSMLQLSFIQKVKENTSLRLKGRQTQKDAKRREAPAQFWAPFYMFFPPPGPALVNWAS